jgi:hypothetical protein
MLKERPLWCLIIAGLLGLGVYFFKSKEAFPSASIDLKVPADRIEALSWSEASRLGYGHKDCIKATGFTSDENAKTFLDYELGLTRSFELMKEKIPVWYWISRYCAPSQQEEMRVWLNPGGRLVAFEHDFENDRQLPSYGHDEALARAKAFIEGDMKQSLEGYKLVDDTPTTQTNRTDYSFIFEDAKQAFNGARLRTIVCLAGNQVSQYNHFLYVPESWQRKFNSLRSYNEVLTTAASVFYVALSSGTFFVFLWAFASGLIRWRFALTIAVISSLLSLLDTINTLPYANFDYSTTVAYSGFQLEQLTSALTAMVQTFLEIFILAASAETIYRKSYPSKIALENIFKGAGLRCTQTLEGLLAGLGAFGVHIGWVVIFYLAGRNFGFWCPLDIENVESLGATYPFFSALKEGWDASIMEEFLYRVIGLSAAQRLVRNFWLANLLQAAAWAFMHSNYAQEPPYARGLELTAVGLLYGFVLRRFGVLACIFAHNLLDSLLGLAPLLGSTEWPIKISGFASLIPFALPLLISLYLRKKHGSNENEALLSNAAIAKGESNILDTAKIVMPTGFIYQPLKPRIRWLLGLIAITFAVIELGFYFPTVGWTAHNSVTREQAVDAARKELKDRGIDLAGYMTQGSIARGIDDNECQYAFEQIGLPKTDALMQKTQWPLAWQIRFFKPLVQQEYLATITNDGRLYSYSMIKPESDAGQSIDKDKAEAAAEEFIKKVHPEVEPFVLDDASVQKREKRTDYTFTFKVPRLKMGDAPYTVNVSWVDGMVMSFGNHWILPDKWLFEHNKVLMRQNVCTAILLFFGSVLVVALIVWSAGVVKSQVIAWKPAMLIGAAAGLLSIVRSIDDAPTFYFGYKTDTPMPSYLIAEGAGQLTGMITTIATTTVLAAFGLAAIRLLLPTTTFAAIMKTTFSPATKEESQANVNIWLDGILLGYCAAFVARGIDTLCAWLHTQLSPVVSLAPLESTSTILGYAYPSIYLLAEALNKGIDTIFLTAIAAGLYFKYLRRFSLFALFIVVQSIINASPDRYFQDMGLSAGSNIATACLSFLFITIARENALAYFLSSYAGTLANGLRLFSAHAGLVYAREVILVVLCLLAPPVYLLVRLAHKRGTK